MPALTLPASFKVKTSREKHYARTIVANPWLLQIETWAPKVLQPTKREDGLWTMKARIRQPHRGRTQNDIDDDYDFASFADRTVVGDNLIFDDVHEAMVGKDRLLSYIDFCNKQRWPMEFAESMAHKIDLEDM